MRYISFYMDDRVVITSSNYHNNTCIQSYRNLLTNIISVYNKFFEEKYEKETHKNNCLTTYRFEVEDKPMEGLKVFNFTGLIINPENLMDEEHHNYINVHAMELLTNIQRWSSTTKLSYDRFENIIRQCTFMKSVHNTFTELFQLKPNFYAMEYMKYVKYKEQKCAELNDLCKDVPELRKGYGDWDATFNFNSPNMYGKSGEVRYIVMLLCGLLTIYDKPRGLKARMRTIAKRCLEHKQVVPFVKQAFIYTDDEMINADFKELLETSFVIEGLLK